MLGWQQLVRRTLEKVGVAKSPKSAGSGQFYNDAGRVRTRIGVVGGGGATFGFRPGYIRQRNTMKVLISLLLWAILLVLCWPLALLLLVLWPLLWLLSIPFRIVGALMNAIIALVTAILLLPARLLGGAK
jgi:hypothetical protein